MDEKHLKKLLDKHYRSQLTDKEQEELFQWYNQEGHHLHSLHPEKIYQAKEEVGKRLGIPPYQRISILKKSLRYAAVLLGILGLSFYLWISIQKETITTDIVVEDQVILPGKDKALLTLFDGSTIDLDELATGQVKQMSGFSIIKTIEGEIKYLHLEKDLSTASKNILTVPYGGQYHITLSDGSKVWLNAGSKLTYPALFDKDQRIVELVGEGYFEVAKNKSPFKVKSHKQEVEVLGTHFNINAYEDENQIKTTLFEGSVRIRSTDHQPLLLKEGQQSILGDHTLSVQEVELAKVLAWKNNFIQFSNNNLDEIMRKIARWYNVEVVFEDESMKTKTFSGKISKYESVDQVLDMLSMTESVHFSIVGRRIIVMN